MAAATTAPARDRCCRHMQRAPLRFGKHMATGRDALALAKPLIKIVQMDVASVAIGGIADQHAGHTPTRTPACASCRCSNGFALLRSSISPASAPIRIGYSRLALRRADGVTVLCGAASAANFVAIGHRGKAESASMTTEDVSKPELRCGFCGRSSHEVKRLIASVGISWTALRYLKSTSVMNVSSCARKSAPGKTSIGATS
jgi:hypothetical protein